MPPPVTTFTITPESLKTSSFPSSTTPTTTVITGGSAGIGHATALLLHNLSPNHHIALLDVSPPSPSSPLHTSPRAHYIPCDVRSWRSQRAAFARAAILTNRIDHVFVNAGINEHGDQFFRDELDDDGELKEPDRRTLNIDLDGAADTLKLAVHWMRKNELRAGEGKERGYRGSVVMTASLAGYLASAGVPLYSAAKHGILGLMRSLKNDLATLGIAVSTVSPGITLTDILAGRNPGQSLGDWAREMRGRGVPINDPEEVAAAVVWLMGQGMQANGKGLLIQAGKCADVEAGIARSRNVWMGEEMLALFRGGRNAPLFPNKL